MTEILNLIRHAMQAERDGYYHYHTAAQRTDDAQAREVFQKLASDELAHHKMLEETHAAYEKMGRDAVLPAIAGGPTVDLSAPSPIFSPEFKERIKDKHFEMSALSIGMTLEQNGIHFYRDLAAKAAHPELKKLLEFLAQWEESHLEALSKQIKYLQEDYWAEARFSPF
jgi:rubrerythrin